MKDWLAATVGTGLCGTHKMLGLTPSATFAGIAEKNKQTLIMADSNNRSSPLVAILVVNGSRKPKYGSWYRLCIEAIQNRTVQDNYRIYVWNNAISDAEAVQYLESRKNLTVVQPTVTTKLAHIHASALDALYTLARDENAKYVVLLDSDAHPIRKGWLNYLLARLDRETVVAGVWRDELSTAIRPYVHPSCLCTTSRYIESLGLPLDYIRQDTGTDRHDALSFLSEEALERGLKCFKLRRSNKRNAHRIIGGIYGDLIYHHGAGSRAHFGFWDDDGSLETALVNSRAASVTESLLFTRYQDYISWLMGAPCADDVDQVLSKLQKYRPSRARKVTTLGKRYLVRARNRASRSLLETPVLKLNVRR